MHVPLAPHVGTSCSPLTTRFSRSVVLAAMGAMLPPMPPSIGMRIVTITNHRDSQPTVTLSPLMGHELFIFHGQSERLQAVLELKISKSTGRIEQLSQKSRNFAAGSDQEKFGVA